MPGYQQTPVDPGQAVAELRMQQEANRRRVEFNQLYLDEISEVPVAIAAYRAIMTGSPVGAARVIGDHGTVRELTTDACNPTRFVEVEVPGMYGSTVRRAGVLKIMGHAKEPGEGPALEQMRAAGVHTVNLLGYAEIGWSDGSRAVAVITEVDPGTKLDLLDDPRPVLAQAFDLIDALKPLRDADIQPPAQHRTFADRLMLHFDETMPNLEHHRISTAERRTDVLGALRALGSAPGAQLIHGDPAPVNWLRRDDGTLIAFDPRGEVYGVPECDMAGILVQYLDRFVAEQGGTAATERHVDAMVDATVQHCSAQGETIDRVRLKAAMGVHLAQWAGYAVPSPARAAEIAAGLRPDDEFADPARVVVGKFGAEEKFALGWSCIRDFMRTPEFRQHRSETLVLQS